MASIEHSDGRLYHFYFSVKECAWYRLTTQADFRHFGLTDFQAQYAPKSTAQVPDSIQQNKLGYEQMHPPKRVMKELYKSDPELLRLGNVSRSSNIRMSPGEFRAKMLHRQALRAKYPVIRVPSDFQHGDEYKAGIIFNYVPHVLDGKQFHLENVCLCCNSGCDDSNCTEDALQDGIMFHYCYTLNVWYMMIDYWCLDDEPELREEMLTNQRSSHAKYAAAKAVFDTPEFKAQEATHCHDHPTLAPAHPSDVLRCTTQTRRFTKAGAPIEALKWHKAMRPSTCLHGIDACLREYTNPAKMKAHCDTFIHPWPINNIYPGLNYITPITYMVVPGENEPVTKFMTKEACTELFIKGFTTPFYRDPGLSLEDVDRLPVYQEIITRKFFPGDIDGILGDLWTPLQKQVHKETVFRLHVLAQALRGGGSAPLPHPFAQALAQAFH